ncbi:hypothetical protein GQX73_g3031 [Xylaria multiplex]|uniref:DUF7932 domain-containing protein n=1 Tax=Xylaria multiplex TaxID=323545 RepID=A0A7C8IRM4_9PEZI|nr:hypothetical protein GQX73_g3031 [Xylaria multiplex]
MDVKLSVDGRDGRLIAQSTGLRGHLTDGDRVLQLYDQSVEYDRNGRPGMDAPRSIPGSAAGYLSVQIVESPVIKGGIRAIILASQSSHELPRSVDVPVGRDLLLTAIGGNGEDGMNGGDGVDGRDGVNGVDASETSEATPGSNGGNGGESVVPKILRLWRIANHPDSAGHGGNGGHGGDGGNIEIVVHEEQAHLLIAVKWDLSGGKGGQPGKHGQPGGGGRRGKGGKGYEWTERNGFIYSCTARCLGGDTTTNSSSVVHYKPIVDMRRNLALARVAAQVATGSNTAQAVTRLQELNSPEVSPGACKCHGGQEHCTGCDSRPLIRAHKRVEGLDGLKGHSGAPGTSVLYHGVDGLQGNVTIVVQKSDGSRQEYSSLYNLELTDFDVEDENGDGIFEPGEYLFIRRITVQNSGGMPSPTRSIHLNVVESDWFKLVDEHNGQTFLPSIREGSSVTIDGLIKVQIREREEHEIPETGVLFIRHEAIRLNAIVPQVEREIPNFKFNRVIEIKYPCELRNFQALATVAQGSQSKLSFEVYNHGSVSIGPHGYNPRVVEIDVSFPAAFGELESEPDQWRESITIISGDIRGGRGLVLERQLRVHNNAQSYQHAAALFKLYLGKPKQSRPDGQYEVNLVHVVEIKMQVSDHYTIHPGASFLLVTNSETGGERAQSIRRFINNSLGMEVDTWNMSLYAGLDGRDQDSGAVASVLSRYHGKTIIFLGNQFGFFGQGRKNIFDLCDPEDIATAAANDTNLLFLDTPDFEPHKKLISEISFWPRQPISGTRANVSQSHQFHSVLDFIAAIIQQRQYCDLSHERYAITLPKKWHHVASLRPEALAKKVAKQLRRKLPTERFLITFQASSPLDIVVAIGIPHRNSMAALERQAVSEQSADTSESDGLPPVEAYMIVEAIALHHRVGLLWNTVAGSVSNGNVVAIRSQFAIEALTTSLIQTTHREVELLLHKAPWPDELLPSNPSKHSFEELKALFASHLPTLHAILFHPLALEPAVVVNDNILSVLSYALAATRPQSKRQIAARVLTPTHNRRRRTNAFLRTGITMFLRKKGFTGIQLWDFFSRAGQVHTLSNPTKRNTSAAILRMVAGLTKQSEHAVVRGKQDASDLVRGSSYLPPGDWDSRAAAAKEQSRKIKEEANEARKMLEKMLVS